jgi:hypothetical protein
MEKQKEEEILQKAGIKEMEESVKRAIKDTSISRKKDIIQLAGFMENKIFIGHDCITAIEEFKRDIIDNKEIYDIYYFKNVCTVIHEFSKRNKELIDYIMKQRTDEYQKELFFEILEYINNIWARAMQKKGIHGIAKEFAEGEAMYRLDEYFDGWAKFENSSKYINKIKKYHDEREHKEKAFKLEIKEIFDKLYKYNNKFSKIIIKIY